MARTEVQIKTQDGVCPASVFKPAGKGPWPAVLMYLDGPGIRPALWEMGERLAGHGYYVLLPDLFYRGGSYPPNDVRALFGNPERRAAWQAKYQGTATIANCMRDTRACLDFLSAQPEVKQSAIGTTGYCMGGARSLTAMATYPDRVVAAASYHGGNLANDAPDSPHLLAAKMKGRVYVAGAVEDPFFDDKQKTLLIDAFKKAGTNAVVETYAGAKHGWVPTDTPVYNQAGAEKHWQTLIALFDATLKGKAA
ncbi:MAG TPA: dienelactone hydrolase family protein [bacterium]